MTTMTCVQLVKQDSRGRVRYDRERREELLGEFERSGMSAAGFARLGKRHIQRLWRMEGLRVPPTKRKIVRRGVSTGLPTHATHRGHVWTWDFIADATMRGGALRMLTILDEYTRECLIMSKQVCCSMSGLKPKRSIRAPSLSRQRQGEPEGAALADLAFYANFSPMRFDGQPAEGEPESGAVLLVLL